MGALPFGGGNARPSPARARSLMRSRARANQSAISERLPRTAFATARMISFFGAGSAVEARSISRSLRVMVRFRGRSGVGRLGVDEPGDCERGEGVIASGQPETARTHLCNDSDGEDSGVDAGDDAHDREVV